MTTAKTTKSTEPEVPEELTVKPVETKGDPYKEFRKTGKLPPNTYLQMVGGKWQLFKREIKK